MDFGELKAIYLAKKQDEDAAAAAKAANDAKLAGLRTSATTNARSSALDYFKSRGLDPNLYAGDIDSKINAILGSTADDDPNVGQYLGNIGQTVYGSSQDAARTKALFGVNSIFSPNYDRTAISDTAADPYLGEINNTQRKSADDYITNLLKRHVITQSGANSAESNLDTQGSRVRTQLNTLGENTIVGGRSKILDIENRAKSNAQTLNLGDAFDPSSYAKDASDATSRFLSSLGDTLKGSAPSNLYDTSGLASIAGAGQGAQNLAFDPRALAGLNINQDPNDPLAQNKPSRVAF